MKLVYLSIYYGEVGTDVYWEGVLHESTAEMYRYSKQISNATRLHDFQTSGWPQTRRATPRSTRCRGPCGVRCDLWSIANAAEHADTAESENPPPHPGRGVRVSVTAAYACADVRATGFDDATHILMASQCMGADLVADIFGLARRAPKLRCVIKLVTRASRARPRPRRAASPMMAHACFAAAHVLLC